MQNNNTNETKRNETKPKHRTNQERKWKNFVEKYCVENVTVLPIYWHIILMVLVLCPLVVMIICYSAIFWKVFRQINYDLLGE